MNDSSYPLVSSGLDDDLKPVVSIRWKEKTWTFNLVEARQQADDIMAAAAIAQTEEAIADLVEQNSPKYRGFGLQAHVRRSENIALTTQMLKFFRQSQPELKYARVIMGANTHQSIVEILLDSTTTASYSIAGARELARFLFEAAESAETDGFLTHFLSYKEGCSIEEGLVLLQEFRKFRQSNRLESLLNFEDDRSST